MTKKDCKPHFDLQVKEREISEAIVRAMVKQNWFCEKYNNMGLGRTRYFIYFDGDGEQCLKQYPVWTEKGVKMIKEMIHEQRAN